MKLSSYEYAGTTSFFMRVLLDKKYALPFSVVDALVDHFLRFSTEERDLPVVWHQTLLTFVQRYKAVMDKESKKLLFKLVTIKSHYLITPEIRRELAHGKSRGEADPMDADNNVSVGGFSKAIKTKVLEESVHDMPAIPMLSDDQY
jgi:essential nuclear protein 1